MKRNAIQALQKWKASEDRKPLVRKGARQVGKTWLMKEFGSSYYEHYVYFNFDEEDELKFIFGSNKNPQRIIELLVGQFVSPDKIIPPAPFCAIPLKYAIHPRRQTGEDSPSGGECKKNYLKYTDKTAAAIAEAPIACQGELKTSSVIGTGTGSRTVSFKHHPGGQFMALGVICTGRISLAFAEKAVAITLNPCYNNSIDSDRNEIKSFYSGGFT